MIDSKDRTNNHLLPNFVSSVIVIGLVKILFSPDGIITNTVTAFGSAPAFLKLPTARPHVSWSLCLAINRI